MLGMILKRLRSFVIYVQFGSVRNSFLGSHAQRGSQLTEDGWERVMVITPMDGWERATAEV